MRKESGQEHRISAEAIPAALISAGIAFVFLCATELTVNSWFSNELHAMILFAANKRNVFSSLVDRWFPDECSGTRFLHINVSPNNLI